MDGRVIQMSEIILMGYKKEPCHENTFRVCDQVRLKPACCATETS